MSTAYIAAALKDCESALERPEKWFSSCCILSNMFASQGQAQSAYLWRMQAQLSQPSRLSYHILAASAYAQLKRWKEAIAHNKKALDVDQNLAIAHFNLAHIYERIGQLEVGLDYLYKFTALRPEQPDGETCERLGKSLLQRGETERAINCFRWAIENDSELWSAYYYLADLLVKKGNPELAMRFYQLLLKRSPEQAEAYQKLGMLLLERQDYPAAVQQFRQAIRHNPDFVWPHLGLAKALSALQQWEEVIPVCQSALKLSSELHWAHSHMAQAFTAQQRPDQASDCLQQVCRLRGWPGCAEQGYQFTRDPFSHKIERWSQQLDRWMQTRSRHPLQVVQVGGAQGMWTCWLADQILTQADDQLVCFDQAFSPQFRSNLNRLKSPATVQLKKGNPAEMLEQLSLDYEEACDLIYIQDRCKKAQQLYDDARFAWTLLQTGGMMVFRDYHSAGKAADSPKAGIDRFLSEIPEQFDILYQERQLFIQKRFKQL